MRTPNRRAVFASFTRRRHHNRRRREPLRPPQRGHLPPPEDARLATAVGARASHKSSILLNGPYNLSIESCLLFDVIHRSSRARVPPSDAPSTAPWSRMPCLVQTPHAEQGRLHRSRRSALPKQQKKDRGLELRGLLEVRRPDSQDEVVLEGLVSERPRRGSDAVSRHHILHRISPPGRGPFNKSQPGHCAQARVALTSHRMDCHVLPSASRWIAVPSG
jgi:hypothetical protein